MASSQFKIPYPSAGQSEMAGIGHGPLHNLIGMNDFGLNTVDIPCYGDAVAGIIDPVTNGTAAAVGMGTNGRGITLTTGTDDNGYAGIALALAWKGDLGLLAEYWLLLPAAITTMKIEAGVTDALADAGAVNVKATPTANAADYGVFVRDTDDDNTLAFHSAKAGTIVASEGLVTPAADDQLYVAVRVVDDNVEAWYKTNGMRTIAKVTGHGGSAGIEGGSLLTPWIFAQARAVSASRVLTVLRARITGALV